MQGKIINHYAENLLSLNLNSDQVLKAKIIHLKFRQNHYAENSLSLNLNSDQVLKVKVNF